MKENRKITVDEESVLAGRGVTGNETRKLMWGQRDNIRRSPCCMIIGVRWRRSDGSVPPPAVGSVVCVCACFGWNSAITRRTVVVKQRSVPKLMHSSYLTKLLFIFKGLHFKCVAVMTDSWLHWLVVILCKCNSDGNYISHAKHETGVVSTLQCK